MDFDDLLLNMLRVLRESEFAKNYYQNRFRYIMVDEYQDTNSVQYELVHILADKYKNIFVVGDDDQSIYAWRGADIRNILDFERDYEGTKSHQARAELPLPCENSGCRQRRHQKRRRSARIKPSGLPRESGSFPRSIPRPTSMPRPSSSPGRSTAWPARIKAIPIFAVLFYRTHTQSRVLEEKLRVYGIPYQIFGGMSFFARKEIKDMVAYLTLYENPLADTALARIVNVPKRDIGEVSVDKLRSFAAASGLSLLEAMEKADDFMNGGKAKFASFLETVEKIKKPVRKKRGRNGGSGVSGLWLSGYAHAGAEHRGRDEN